MTINEIKEKGLLLFNCISGSRAYGLATEQSDTDLKGVYYLPKEQFYGLEYIGQVNNETNDEVYYELGRFIELLIKNNPNMLELLASADDCVLYKHPLMNKLPIELFLSKICKHSFGGYAITQIRKARGYNKKIVNPLEKTRKDLLDFCFVLKGHSSVVLTEWLTVGNYDQQVLGLSSIPHSKGLYAIFYDGQNRLGYSGIISGPTANEVSLSSIPKGEKEIAYLYFNREGYSTYCREYREYWNWVSKRNDTRYLGNISHGKDYDAKNMMHTIRLLQVALEIAQQGKLTVRRTNRDELLAIKAGKFDYQALIKISNGLMRELEKAYDASTLQDVPDEKKLTTILVEIRKELYS
jgi:uncharacterized protein